MKKTLLFEGAGCMPYNDVENCRLRTAFINNNDEAVYLELMKGYHHSEECKNDGLISVDFAFYVTGKKNGFIVKNGGDDCTESRVKSGGERIDHSYRCYGRYTKRHILLFVNRYFNCNFDDIKVDNGPNGYRVHGKVVGEYNLMEGYCRKEN